jgi:hypothetical protein
VIIDGISGEGDAMEIGTYQDCTNGVASYGAFVNIYPMTQYYGETGGNISDVAVHPGDVVEAQGTWRPANVAPINWNTNFIDETTNVEVDTDAETNSTFTPVLNSGAIILSSDGHTLTALNPIQSGVQYSGVKFSDITGPQRANSTFGDTASMPGFNLVALQMSGTNLGALSDSGSSFQITSSTYSLTSVSINSSANNLLSVPAIILISAVALILIVAVAVAFLFIRRK